MKLNIEYINVNDIKPYNRNNKKHEDFDVGEIAKSIEKYGMNDPIGVWKGNVIIEGHGRFEACKQIGMTEIPCIHLDHLTDKQRREYAIAHNKTLELAEYNFENLEFELPELDLSDFDFDFDFGIENNERAYDNDPTTYEERLKEFNARMESGELSEDDEEYQEFVQKFEAKKTTDDCYTPPIVYEAVADYVAKHYGLNKNNFVRPFVPGGDYQAEKYKPTDIVVDNPPFSIMAEILKFYNENNIKFFLFAPHLTIFSSSAVACSCLICGVTITYENGARVNTSFVTNLENCQFRSAPELYKAIKNANAENLKSMRKELPKYSYPMNVITSPMITNFSRCGIDFEVAKDECFFIRQLDCQKESGNAIFGAGYLISERKRAERAEKMEILEIERVKKAKEKAKEKAEIWELSERELKIIEGLK